MANGEGRGWAIAVSPPKQREIDKAMKNWEKADAAWKKAAKKSQEAANAYHWTTRDNGAKWNKTIALRGP